MRIDILQPQPLPEVPKVSGKSASSAANSSTYNRSLRKSASGGEAQKPEGAGKNSLSDRVDQINENLRRSGRKIQFKIHRDPNRIIVQIVDADTDEVIKEIPSEKMLEMMDELQKLNGNSIDKKV